MKQYLDLLRYVLENGVDKMDRTGVGIRSVFGSQTRYNLKKGFPIVTTKKLRLTRQRHQIIAKINGFFNKRSMSLVM